MGELREVPPYTALAAGYDLVMDHVDYLEWARYAHGILSEYVPEGGEILELGSGTGSLALELQPLGGYDYLATDQSDQMVRVARWKAQNRDVPVRFRVLEFSEVSVRDAFDAVILLYDGLNYLLELDEVRDLIGRVETVIRPGGLFLFDQSTPANSEADPSYFEDEGGAEGFSYRRTSRYDPDTRRHVTRFELEIEGRTYLEEHVQRAYTPGEVAEVLEESAFRVEASYEGLTRESADRSSGRVHWVTRMPEDRSAP